VSHDLRGEDIRRWRENLGLHQEDVARELGIAREWLSKIENGKVAVSAEVFLAFERLEREHGVTSDVNPAAVQEAPAAYGPADRLRGEIRGDVETTIAAAGDDVGRLGWIREQVRAHVTPPASWRDLKAEAQHGAKERLAAAKAQKSDGDARRTGTH
jgi:transcriptional regulator with XRE-family HTH domain